MRIVEREISELDAVLTKLQARVEERRRSGYYPLGLEEALTTHTRRMLHHHTQMGPQPDLRRRLEEIAAALPFDANRIPAASGLPGGEMIHKGVAKLVSRQTQGTLAEVEAFARPVRDALAAIVDVLERLTESLRADIEALYDRQAAQERALALATERAPDGSRPEPEGPPSSAQ